MKSPFQIVPHEEELESGRSTGAGGGPFFAKKLYFDFFPLFLLCAQALQSGDRGIFVFFFARPFLKEAPTAKGWATVVVVRACVVGGDWGGKRGEGEGRERGGRGVEKHLPLRSPAR
jgi:hypothetical protein